MSRQAQSLGRRPASLLVALLALALLAPACTSTATPAAVKAPELITGTDVPVPPAELNMAPKTGVGPGGADVPGIYAYAADPAYENDVVTLHEFYTAQMKKNGWTLRADEPPHQTSVYPMVFDQLWSKGDELTSISAFFGPGTELDLFVNACPPAEAKYCA